MKKFYKKIVCMIMTLGALHPGGFLYGQISHTQGWEVGTDLDSWVDGGTNGAFSRSTTTPCVGSASARANNYYGGTSSLRSPVLTGTNGGDLTVDFLYKVTDYNDNSVGAPLGNLNNIQLQWGTSTSGPWTTVHTINSSNHIVSGSCAPVSAVFSGLPTSGDVYIRFSVTAGSYPADNYVYFDDVVISQGAPPTCFPPSAITLDGLTAASAAISWTVGVSSETVWNIEWGTPGFQPGIGDEIGAQSVSGTPEATISMLTPETAYDIYVQADCDADGTSTWVGPFNITTTVLCPAVTAITLDGLTSTSVDVSWTAGSTETSWNVEWGASGFAPGTGDEIGGQSVSGTPEITIPGLTPETTYHVYVQADCDADGISLWTGPFTVYTGYCIPVYTMGDYTSGFTTTGAYTNVTFSASSSFNYQNLSAGNPITYIAGEDFNFTHSYVGGSNTLRIWVDWNNDLIFDSSEEVYQNYTSGANQSGSITIPPGTPNGNYRMRIRSRFSTTVPGACSSETYGSALDYTIVVVDEIVAPSITQTTVTPDCTGGADLETSGTPGADETWYWQETANGESTADDATTPWTVYENGTYYVRTHNTLYDVWSDADSIVVTNIPTAPTPPTPVAAQNPACEPGTDISVAAAPAGIEYYWQGTSNTSSSTTENASTPYAVTATGTYYVKAFEAATGCWSEPAGILVTVDDVIPNAPLVLEPNVFVCEGETSILIEADAEINTLGSLTTLTSGGNGCTGGAMFDVITTGDVPVTGFDVVAGTNGAQNVNVYYKTGSYIGSETNSSAWTLVGTYPINGLDGQSSFIDVDDFILTGGQSYGFFINYNADYTDVPVGTTYTDGFMTVTVGAGVCTVWSTPNAGRAFNGTIHYGENLPGTVTWYDAATGGNEIGVGTPFETVGTSVLASPATNGVYEFYAESQLGGCSGANRSLVTVFVTSVNVDLDPIDVSCNNGNDGSFSISNVECGDAPFTFSVDGGAFGAAPTDLTAGTYTVTVMDGNGNESAAYTIVIESADGPSDLTIDSYTNNEVTISWTVNGSETEWNIEWGLPGFTPGTGTETGSITTTTNPYTITGLTGDTEYDIYVSANCGAGTTVGDWVYADVLTNCDPLSALGWCEDFEDIDLLGCWKVINANGDGDLWAIYSGYANSGNQSAGLYTDYNAGNNDDYLVTPGLTLTGNEVLTFSYRARSSSEPNDFRVVLSTTGSEAADFTEELLALMTVSNTTYRDTFVNLSAYTGDVYIAFHVPPGGLDGWYIYIDDVCVDICVPNPGVDGTVDVCRLDGTVDLNTVITSDYAHGTWSFPANPGVVNGSIFNISTLASDTYHVQYILTTACTADTTIATVNVYNPSSAGANGLITACTNQPIDLMGGLNGNVDFGGTWYNSSGTALAGSYFTTGTLTGQTVYRYVVSNGVCDADTAEVIVDIQGCNWLGLEDLTSLENVSVAPNPNQGNFQIIGIPGADYTFEVLDLNGRVVRSARKITSSITDVNLTDVENGVYMVRIAGNDSERMIRVIKQN